MDVTPSTPFLDRPTSRRTVLGLLAASGLGVALGGCVDTSDGGGTRKVKAGDFRFPDSGAKLPSGDVELRWVDSGDQKAAFFSALFAAYHKKHANISVHYQGTNWNTIQQEITLGLRNGTAPDVFQLPIQIPKPEAVEKRWISALDDIVPDWAAVKARFPVGMFANGVTDFDGKTYGIPFVSNQRVDNLLLFNADLTGKTGYDLHDKVLSWDELRTVARKCTKQGKGKYYGVIFGIAQPGALSQIVSTMVEMAGGHGGVDAGSGLGNEPFGGIDWRTGKFNYTNDLNVGAIETMLALKRDGSVFPGSTSLDVPGARGRMPQGVAAMMFSGPWNIDPWLEENPSFKLGLNVVPQHDPKQIWPLCFGPGGASQWFYSSKTKQSAVIGDLFSYIVSTDGQVQWADFNGAANPPVMDDALAKADLEKLHEKALDLGAKYRVIRPEPAVRNPDVAKAYQAAVSVQPNFSDTLVGLYTGQIESSVKQAMKDLEDRSERALERAIGVARKRGADVSRDDWVFSDWNPREAYAKLYRK